MATYKTFADALSAPQPAKPAPTAANDNHRQPKRKESRYRGTLPALRWLYDNHPDVAPAMADAVQALSVSNWDPEAGDDYLEIRPTVGELVRAATDADCGEWCAPKVGHDKDGNSYIRLGALRFERGQLVEYGKTRKGRKLEPREMSRPRDTQPAATRDPSKYLAGTPARSPLHAEPYQRPFSVEPALPPMYDPQRDVEANRALLRSFGVDGSVPFDRLPVFGNGARATRCPPAIAKGAEFLGGVVGLSGTSSSGAVNMGDLPPRQKGEVLRIVDAVASGATLKEIGERMGYNGGYKFRAAGEAIVDAAKVLIAVNDNNRKKFAA
ncbi:hypothetical protein [Aquamicrobium soli]|uniref:Uncharacterized protein n=1 Tax=Aquamicrobium soli TaxID=1811518 RepID=A0ABV7KCL0_9HYPH